MRLQTESPLSLSKSDHRWRVWIRAFRLHYVLPSVLPAILGGLIARAQGFPFHTFEFLLVIIGVTVNHFALNMIDDVFDYRYAVDGKQGDEKNPFTGGSGVLPEGLLSVRDMLLASGLFYFITAIIGLYLTWVCGWTVLILGLVGMASSYFYTAPPVKFGYRGFGELGLLINFGPVIVMGAFFVQTRSLAWEPLLISLVLGFMMWSMIIINEIPDYEADRQGGKNNLVVRFGKQKAMILYTFGLIVAYVLPPAGAYLHIFPPYALLALLSLPVAGKSLKLIVQYHDDPIRMAPVNLAMIKIHTLTGSALIGAYTLQCLWPV